MWDTGFDLKLGDEFGGFVEEGQARSVAELLPLFQEAIAKRSPTRGTYIRNRRLPGSTRRNFPQSGLGPMEDQPHMSSEPCVEVPRLVSAVVSRLRERSQERGPGELIAAAVGRGDEYRAPASRPRG